MRAMLVGRNLPGMRTEDILRAFDYAAIASRMWTPGTSV